MRRFPKVRGEHTKSLKPTKPSCTIVPFLQLGLFAIIRGSKSSFTWKLCYKPVTLLRCMMGTGILENLDKMQSFKTDMTCEW